MARARNIKPGLFKNELLGVADPFITLLFESLWTLADREGRLEDRPLRIKAETFPYREGLDVNGFLTELQRLGFILRYSVAGEPLIQILNFKKHQTPHNTEKASILPEYNGKAQLNQNSESITVKDTLSNGEIPASLPPDSLIPSTLIPDLLIVTPKRKTKTKLPDVIEPTQEHQDFAGLNNLSLSAEMVKFRLHHEEKLTMSGNWNSSFSTWLHNAVKYRKPSTDSKQDSRKRTADELCGRTGGVYVASKMD